MQIWDSRWSKKGTDTVKVKAHTEVRAYLNIKQDVHIEYYDLYGKTNIRKKTEEHKIDTDDVVDTETDISLNTEPDTNARHNTTADIPDCCPDCQDKVNTWLQHKGLYIPTPLPSPIPLTTPAHVPQINDTLPQTTSHIREEIKAFPLFHATTCKTDEPLRSCQ